ncbi:unnamed protein product (macronuclear) [Paramecium tetraurelia]|uniref:EF-hand domain-containing protein n=1 Tax=Paramecium tetraurelia TaxID=5888 RepID=A0CPY1_PARTE|nr:uncharacterized protein GSPATT00038805001 [Paramecium tetraurelia]CAK72848.1 unnamed protein product [Paramecium tetraurelia]|eukprot:XP_001440245.1 hypothetical protein (macronuclear) [Paramecium tetraurelia strain d4-2]
MGNEISNGNHLDLESMKRFMYLSPGQVKLIKEKFDMMADEDLTIDRNGLAKLMKLKETEVNKVFQFFDISNDGRIDSNEFICALSLLSQATLKVMHHIYSQEKANVIFSLYDFDHNKTITRNELIMLIKTTLTALGAMSQKGECTIQEAERIADDLLRKYDTNKDESISFNEFQSLLSKDQDVLKMLLSYGLCSLEDLRQDFGGSEQGDVPYPDSDLEQETQRKHLVFDQKREKRKIGIESNLYQDDLTNQQIGYQYYTNKLQSKEIWKNQVRNGQPSNWKPNIADINPPNANLELDYIYGFRCFDSRNNIKFVNQELVYYTAAVGIVYNPLTNTQKFFFEHTDDITSIDVHHGMVATGQVGALPIIYLWEVADKIEHSKAAFKGVLRRGVQCLSFSNDGKKLAAVGMDDDHTLVVYDVDTDSNQALLASGKGPRSFVFDIKFDKADKQLILACKNEVYFCNYDQGQIRLNKGVWDTKVCPISTVLCIGLCDNNVITGTYKGQLIIWKNNRATSSVDAHKSAVLSIHTRTNQEGGIVSGSKDGTIVVWDVNMKARERIDVQNLKLKIFNIKKASHLIFGTRGSEIVEVQGQKSKVLMRGHSQGTLRGLVMHPRFPMFYTIGEDNILACWLIKDKKISSFIRLDYPSSAIHISKDCKYLGVGSVNGTVLIIDPKTLTVAYNFKDRDAEVSCLKFSPDTELLAVGHDAPSCDVIIYSLKNHFKKTNVLRGSPAKIISIDFSSTCRVLQINDRSQQVLYYELGGENNQKIQPDGAYKYKDEKWSTYTAIYGWHVQGIWPALSLGSDINAVDRSNKGDIVISADDYSGIKLFRYPASIPQQGYQRFVGHAAHVTNIRFSADDEYVVSLGGNDKSIMQWKFSNDRDAQIEQDQACDTIQDNQIPKEYCQITMNDEIIQQEGQKQYQTYVKSTQPTDFKCDDQKYNVLPQATLVLDYVLGMKTDQLGQDYCNGVKFLDNGKIGYTCGAVGIIMDPIAPVGQQYCSQTFFKLHQDEITCIAIHPKGRIIATGTKAFALSENQLTPIYVWEAETKKVLSLLNDFHTKMIHCIEFNCNGVFLLSFSQEYSIAIHDWQIGQLIITIKTVRSLIYGICSKSSTEFMSCGQKSVTFYSMNGRNVKSSPGILSTSHFEPMLCCCVAFKEQYEITGSENGNIFLWKENRNFKAYQGHQSKVSSLIPVGKTQLYSSGLDGQIKLWEMNGNNLNNIAIVVDINEVFHIPKVTGIISMDIKNENILIATNQSQILHAPLKNIQNLKVLLDTHYGGEVWGIGVSKTSQTIVTCGGDCILRQWDINQYTLVKASQPFENDIRACDWSADDKYVVVGDVRGCIFLLNSKNLDVLDKKNSKAGQLKQNSQQITNWVEDIKFSPDSTKIAFGVHDSYSQIEVWDIEQGKFSRQSSINISMTGYVSKLDWAVDSIHILINSSSYELKFVNVQSLKDIPGTSVKDLEWHTCTSLFGFYVQGIYQKKDEYQVTAVCLDKQKSILATGECNGLINLYKYPAVCSFNQLHKQFRAHANAVTRIRFSNDDTKLISTSGMDRGIFIWKTDQFKGDQVIKNETVLDSLTLPQEKIRRIGPDKYGKARVTDTENTDDQQFDQIEKGDDSVAIRPWMGVVKEPSNFFKDPLNQTKQPLIELTLEYVHGYRSKDCRNNVKYVKGNQIIYNTAAVAIVLDPNCDSNSNTQKIFNYHNDDVISLDVSSDQLKVATSQLGTNPIIYVWDINSLAILAAFQGCFTKGVSQLAFSVSNDKLAAVGMDDCHQLCIFEISAKSSQLGGTLLIKDQIGKDTVTDIKWKNDNEFVTCGLNHLKFWKLGHGGITSLNGQPQAPQSFKYLCAAVNNDDYLLGAIDGSLQVFQAGKMISYFQYLEANHPLEAINVSTEFILIGGNDSKIVIINSKSYQQILSFKLSECIKNSLGLEVKSIQLGCDLKTLLISTNSGDIVELITTDAKINGNSKFAVSKTIMNSHYYPNKRSFNEIWGLAINPQDSDQYYTCGDDATLRSWSISQKKMLNMIKTNLDGNGVEIRQEEGGELPDNIKGRCIAVSQDGISIVVGFKDGTIRIYDKELRQKYVSRIAKEWISDIKFSKDQSWIAIGSHDNSIYVYSFPDMKQRYNPLKKHSSYITHIDFSSDDNYLHSNCGGYEMLFWELQTGKLLPNGANQLRDEKWLTWTTPFGWPVQGIWPDIQNAFDINAAVRSNQTYTLSDKPPDNYYLIATGDDNSQIKIFRYPCVKKASGYVLGKGHSSHITNIAWSVDDQYLFSTGGEDNSIFQWKINKLK